MTDQPRLIEYAFPLKQASLDSVHEKNVRHGQISTLHIWPARRPLAACRAALIATLLPDPGTPEGRRELCERIAGKVVRKVVKKKMPGGKIVERIKEETVGGILHWIGTEPKSGSKAKKQEHQELVTHRDEELAWFRGQIKTAYGGEAPRLLDPFAGGGAIPLEAMRLGCEATAIDINPVAWFILKCTLEYPQKLASKTQPLPAFILDDEEFMAEFYKAHPHLVGRTKKTRKQKEAERKAPGLFDPADSDRTPKADLAWHFRAWGRWVLGQARKELAPFHPCYADFEPLDLKNPKPYERREMKLVPIKDDGTSDLELLNAEFSAEYLQDRKNPRWVAKPTIASMWARTIKCKHCRADVPLLKTRWLARKGASRVALQIRNAETSSDVVDFDIDQAVPQKGGNAAQRREHDKQVGTGTMTRAGARCPICNTINSMEDIRVAGQSGRLGVTLTSVAIDGQMGKAYRLAMEDECALGVAMGKSLEEMYGSIPFGVPEEPTPKGGGRGAGRAFAVHGYGLTKWCDLFSPRQHLTLSTFVRATRNAREALESYYQNNDWREAIFAGLAIGMDKLCDRQSTICRWDSSSPNLQGTFTRFALPITWDFCEGNPLSETTGSYLANLNWIAEVWEHACAATLHAPAPTILQQSSTEIDQGGFDCVVTDPPYYDAIPYSDLMDFFHIWLRRTLHGLGAEFDQVFSEDLGPKWDAEKNDGELIDDESRHNGDDKVSKAAYEDGMARVFIACHKALKPDGRLVIVFMHKHPDAWETLVFAIIRAGFVVDGSWPIQTEMGNRTCALSGAALASSVWMVCKKRAATAKPGWDNRVLEEMRLNIKERLRDYWDAGIRGPDFVWAATGPAMEAYSKHPIVKKANDPGKVMTVNEFLSHVRRMVVDFVVGQVLTGDDESIDMAAADRMDAPTAYYLLHRHDFGLEEAPAGACILYSTACGVSDRDLEATWNLVSQKGGSASSTNENEDEEVDPDAEAEDDTDGGSGSKLQLKTWAQRKNRTMGYDAPGGQPIPLIDRVHRLMHLWKAGDVHKVDEYLDENGLRRHELFKRLVQSLIELSPAGSEERKLLESLSNHIQAKGATPHRPALPFGDDD